MNNLAAEMTRYGVSKARIREAISCSDKTVNNKLEGKTEFSVGEALKIRDTFFPNMHIGYLFAQDSPAEAEKGA